MAAATNASSGDESRGTSSESLSLDVLFAYSAPALGLGFMGFLLLVYLMKFATDVLLIAPATMGLIFGLSRVWDAVSDPLMGYWSDRTRLRIGRRRPWMLAAIVPTGVFYVMIWSPPVALEGAALTTWMVIAIFGYFAAYTMFSVPHHALGAELSRHYHERTRIFGFRAVGFGLGSFVAFYGLSLLSSSEAPRATALQLAWVFAIFATLLMLWPVVRLRERPEYRGRGASSPFAAWRDVLRNPHARILLTVLLIEHLGMGAMAILAPYVIEYVMNARGFLPAFFGLYFVPMILSIPFWIRASRRFGKKNVWAFSMAMSGLCFGGFFFMGPESIVLMCVLAALAGFAGGCSSSVGPSIQADIIDWDELASGERKEGTYFAAWHFVQKSAAGVIAMLTGFALQAVGFEPNVEQSENTQLAMRALIGLLPGFCFGIALLVFLRLGLSESEHATIRAELARRASTRTNESQSARSS